MERDWIRRGLQAADVKERLRCFKAALQVNPSSVEAAHLLGYTYLHAGDTKKAVRWFERTVEADPRHWAAWNNLAIAFIERGDLESALEAVNRSLDVNPDNPAALDTRSEIYFKTGDHKHAKRDAKDAIELLVAGTTGEVPHGEPWARLGTMYQKKGKLKKAWKYFRRALDYQLDPRDVEWITSQLAKLKRDLRAYVKKKMEKLQRFLKEIEAT